MIGSVMTLVELSSTAMPPMVLGVPNLVVPSGLVVAGFGGFWGVFGMAGRMVMPVNKSRMRSRSSVVPRPGMSSGVGRRSPLAFFLF